MKFLLRNACKLFSAVICYLFVFSDWLRCITCFSEKEVESLSETHDLCVGGDSFEMLQQTAAHLLVIPYVKVLIHA